MVLQYWVAIDPAPDAVVHQKGSKDTFWLGRVDSLLGSDPYRDPQRIVAESRTRIFLHRETANGGLIARAASFAREASTRVKQGEFDRTPKFNSGFLAGPTSQVLPALCRPYSLAS